MEFNRINIIYEALYVRARMQKDNIACIYDLCKSFHIYGSGDKGPKAHSYVLNIQPFNNFYVDATHKALDIYRFAVFSYLYSELKQRSDYCRRAAILINWDKHPSPTKVKNNNSISSKMYSAGAYLTPKAKDGH